MPSSSLEKQSYWKRGDTGAGRLNGALPNPVFTARRPGKYRYEAVVIGGKKGSRTPFRASGTYPHDPALRRFTSVGLAQFMARARGRGWWSLSGALLALFRSERSGRRLKIVQLRRSPDSRRGALLVQWATGRPYLARIVRGRSRRCGGCVCSSAGCQSTSGETNVE